MVGLLQTLQVSALYETDAWKKDHIVSARRPAIKAKLRELTKLPVQPLLVTQSRHILPKILDAGRFLYRGERDFSVARDAIRSFAYVKNPFLSPETGAICIGSS
jgi:hypothetical protein